MDRRLIGEIVVAGLAFAGLHQFAEHSAAIIGLFPNEIFASLLLVVAIGLFMLRKFLRASFGLLEIMIGMDALWNIQAAAPLVVDGVTRTQFLVQVAGGVYFIIRGLDNADQSSVVARLRKAWA